MNKHEHIIALFHKYMAGLHSDEELDELLHYFGTGEEEAALRGFIQQELNNFSQQDTDIENVHTLVEGLEEQVFQKIRRRRNSYQVYKYLSAAVLLIALSFGAYFYQKDSTPDTLIFAHNDIAPGGNKAYLTLVDGSTIDLSDTKAGIIMDENELRYNDGSLVTDAASILARKELDRKKEIQYLKLTTPKGGKYQVTLPDGSKVWLNAASTLNYPAHFIGAERRVELSGEAYFEVSHVSDQSPFIVSTKGQEVKVLGTHFNVKAYNDEVITKTTLLEGSVQVTSIPDTKKGGQNPRPETRILAPNQQSMLNRTHQTLQVSNANIEEAIAWKKGYFRFDDEPIESIMQKLARWYDIEVEYEGEPSTAGFTGTASTDKNISAVLLMLEQTKGVRFKIEGRRVVVMR